MHPQDQPANKHDINLLQAQVINLEAQCRTLRDLLLAVIKEQPAGGVHAENFAAVFQERSLRYRETAMLWYEDRDPEFAAYMDSLAEPPSPPDHEPPGPDVPRGG